MRYIINRLSYLKDLGINVIWICSMYKSLMDDGGGGDDIADYYSVDPIFGSSENFDELIDEAKMMRIKILLDLVVNHISDEHKWFKESLNDPDSTYRKYYHFVKGSKGKPPSNWRSYFAASA